MQSEITYLLFPGLFIVSFLGTAIIRRAALNLNVVDIPTERSSHSIPTPRGGGIAIVISWYIGITILLILGYIELKLFLALISGVLLAITSLIDDLFSVKPYIRLVTQLITAILALFFLGGIEIGFTRDSELLGFFILPLTILGIVWFINLFNFMDGIDAYSSLEAMFILAGMYLFIRDQILLVLFISLLGFLFWNWPKARIFMGDVGSTQLGFIIAVVGLDFHNTTDFKLVHWLMITSLFWFDATLTLFRRIIHREKLSRAHKKHAYQRIVQAGFSHLRTDIFALMINMFILILLILSFRFEILTIPAFLLILLLLYIITSIIDRKVPF